MEPKLRTNDPWTAARIVRATLVSAGLIGLAGCGPTISLEPGSASDGDDAEGGSTTSTTTVTSSPPPPPPPTTTSTGPLDTGSLDTGEPWLDLPEDCSIFEQDCPLGFKCMPYANDGGNSWNDTKCVPLAPDPGAPGDPCTVEGNGTSGLDDCDGTSMCWDVDLETNTGICVAQCVGTADMPSCSDPCHFCTIMSGGIPALCFPSCDPVAQNCPTGQACYPTYEAFACMPDASLGAVIGDPCEFVNLCSPGSFCLGADRVPGCPSASGCCAPVCPAGGADPCPSLMPGTECVPWYDDRPPPPQLCVAIEPGICAIP